MTSRTKRGEAQTNLKSRRLLVREILKSGSAREGLNLAMDELHTGQYRGANFVIADPESGWVVHGGNDLNACELEQGLSIVTDKDPKFRLRFWSERMKLRDTKLKMSTIFHLQTDGSAEIMDRMVEN